MSVLHPAVTGAGHSEPFEDTGARPVVIGIIIEDDIDKAHPEHGSSPNVPDLGDALQVGDQGKGYLVFNDLGAAAHPSVDNDLVFDRSGMASMGFCRTAKIPMRQP